ncbi:FAD-linked oxidase C-terminal domain-containing protein [Nonomuraea sp. NPDC050022]|uniref:FAD-linked oxidase C-terminal domain-containing protein n=1 Tax=unclassified Nonomuraea TaxID=2593643 RepID=UPI0033BFF3F4
MAIEPRRTVTGEHGLTTLRQPWPEKAIGGAGRRPAARAKATFDPLGNLDPDEVV